MNNNRANYTKIKKKNDNKLSIYSRLAIIIIALQMIAIALPCWGSVLIGIYGHDTNDVGLGFWLLVLGLVVAGGLSILLVIVDFLYNRQTKRKNDFK